MKFSNSIQNLLEVPTNCFYGPPKGQFNNSKPMIVAYNHQEHGHLLFNITVDTVPKKTSGSKKVTKLEKGTLFILSNSTQLLSLLW
jgi:hypothetical protein